jgi:hypothetical protein
MSVVKVSDITITDVIDYLRLDEVSEADRAFLETALSSAKSFVYNYTGLSSEQADLYSEFVIAIYVLCQDMFDNRTLYVSSSNVNKVVEAILGLHSVNLL